MSFVGPRPEVRKYVDLYNKDQYKVLSVKPGLSDFASLAYANENEILATVKDPERFYIESIMPDKILLNMKFIDNPSIYNYILVLYLTLKKILTRK